MGAQEIKCPFKKMKCHMICPSSMPASVEELKLTAEHMACHTECGKDEKCHKSCGSPKMWTQRKERCAEHERVASCHRNCGHDHWCHASCPRMSFFEKELTPAANAPGSLAKEVLDKSSSESVNLSEGSPWPSHMGCTMYISACCLCPGTDL